MNDKRDYLKMTVAAALILTLLLLFCALKPIPVLPV